jgi:hypothetical protein
MRIDGTEIHIHLVDDPGFVCAGSLAGRKDIGKNLIFASSRHQISQYQKHVLNLLIMRTQSLRDKVLWKLACHGGKMMRSELRRHTHSHSMSIERIFS